MVNKPEIVNVYSYNARNLWLSYGIVLLATSLALLVGSLAVYKNGVSYKNGFAALLSTTRNQTLSALINGLSLATRPLDKATGKMYLRYGLLKHASSHESAPLAPHVAFGLDSEISEIKSEKGALPISTERKCSSSS
jgi:hypothetical protein